VYYETDLFFLSDIQGVETVLVIGMLVLFLLQGMKFLYCAGAERSLGDGKGVADRHMSAAGFTAIVAMVAFLALWLFATLSDPLWEFGADAPYLLGLSGDVYASEFYSLACLAGGLFLILFGVQTGMMHRGYPRSIAGTLFTATGILLVCMGLMFLVAEDVWDRAELCAVLLGAAALLLIIVNDWKEEKMITAAFYFVLLLSGVTALWALDNQTLLSFFVLAWFAVVGIEGIRLCVRA
jgi:hypothetical protein